MIVIPEMFDKTEITVEKIVNLVISSIIKRKIMGMDYGAAVISEGVFHALSDEEIRKSGIHFTYDEHGHPELGKVSKAHIFNEMLEKKLKELETQGQESRPVELGYEVRCQTPIAYDLVYCSELGIGVLQALLPRARRAAWSTSIRTGNVYAALPQRPAGSRRRARFRPVWSTSSRTSSSRWWTTS